ncbi:unnamed protein product [Calypogeia fissa]
MVPHFYAANYSSRHLIGLEDWDIFKFAMHKAMNVVVATDISVEKDPQKKSDTLTKEKEKEKTSGAKVNIFPWMNFPKRENENLEDSLSNYDDDDKEEYSL